LVYVVGLQPGIKETELLQTLRGDKYFGQYGQILKIVVSKPKSSDPNPNSNAPIGVYVTFARKEDATRCIQAVNGSTNLGTVLRAQLGTTKYCSAYLRNETCTNKQCMFLHEPGDNEDSYSRQDLSSLRGEATQKPLPITSTSSRQAAQAQTPSQSIQPVAAASQPMGREASKDGSDSGDGSALPSTASWGSRPFQQQSRRGSVAASLAASSPAVSTALPTHVLEPAEPVREAPEEPAQQASAEPAEPTPPVVSALDAFLSDKSPEYVRLFKAVRFMKFNPTPIPGAEDFPPLFDPYGGLKRRAWREQQEETRLHVEPELQTDMQSISDAVEDEPESGSGQLGGEPEERSDDRESLSQSGFLDQRRLSSQQPIQQRAGHDGSSFGGSPNQNFAPGLSNLSSINARNLTPLQQQQLMLLKSGQTGQAQGGFMEQLPPGLAGTSQSTLFQQPGHNRQASRYAFANENVKSASAAKIGGMQSSMMPAQPGQFYGTSMPGPPPGLKSTGTPPMGSGGMFGQSHGFGGALGGNAAFGAAKDSNSEMLREMLRNRGGMASGGQIHDAAKRESMFPSFLHQYPSASTPAPAPGLAASLYGTQPGAFQDFGKQKKKGKKHRHANTSSSGGGGLVDLADPMFQARMPLQQQQSNAGAGQGLFGGHGQGGFAQNSMYGGGFPRW
jgi:CCR4-NOT transcription complex subunit 4